MEMIFNRNAWKEKSTLLTQKYADSYGSLLNGVLACCRALYACMVSVIYVLACFAYFGAWRATWNGVFDMLGMFQNIGMLHKIVCLACFMKWMLYVLHNMACLACFIKWRAKELLNWFLEYIFVIKFHNKNCIFIKKNPLHRCFSVNFVKCFRTAFLQNICEWLPLI